MSAEKRSVHTDALATLGTIIDDNAARDAIHLAVEPAIAGVRLLPGQHVGFVDERATPNAEKKLGIVDPFLDRIVEIGQLFWLIVYPRQITSLRHVWSHPDFDEPAVNNDKPITSKVDEYKLRLSKVATSEDWLRRFCNTHDCPDYDTVMHAILDGNSIDDESLHFGGVDANGDIPDEFWDHVEIVTGQEMPNRPRYFSCAC